MYRNRKNNRNAKGASREVNNKKKVLNIIDENTAIKVSVSTIFTLLQRTLQKTKMHPFQKYLHLYTKHPRNDDTNNPTSSVDENREGASKPTTTITKDRGNSQEMFSSEENIPASQEPTQRYLSQRSIAASLTRTQSSRSKPFRLPNSYFELVLMKAGVQLDELNNFVLSCDHITFVNQFREIFLNCSSYTENIIAFNCGLSEALTPSSQYNEKLLSGCTIKAPGGENVYQSQQSMIVNFLMINFLCDPVLEILLEKIAEAAQENIQLTTVNDIPLLPLMLAQLRYVTFTHGEKIYQRIKVIFVNASETAKWDIIANAGFILDASKHDDFAQLLLDNLTESKDMFSKITIEALTSLYLSEKMQGKLRCRILDFIREDQCSNASLALLVKFLLKALNEANDDTLRELVNTIREILMRHTKSSSNVEKQTQLELFKYIEQGLIRSKRFHAMWQKTIATMPALQFRSIDFIMLLVLVKIREDNYLYIENTLRRRIKLEYLHVDVLNEAKAKYTVVLEQETNILMQILHDFLREKNKVVADFAKASYCILFECCESTQHTILRKLMELACDKSTQNMTNLALCMLKDLQRKYPESLQYRGILLMPLLERFSDMSLSQTRLVMEILCSIAYPVPNLTACTILQEQIDMEIKKKMINRSPLVKKQGVIGSVQLIDSLARIEETGIQHDDFNLTFNTTSDLPEGRGKMAALLCMHVRTVCLYCPEMLALFFDELASVCATSANERANNKLLDKSFVIWLCDIMTLFFQNNFIAEHSPEAIFGINLSYQKCINSAEDTNTEESEVPGIAVNISELVLKPTADAYSSILVLAPLFNLVCTLHVLRNQGSLEQINALLGCAIILPTFFDDPYTDAIFYDYDVHIQKKILDIYFQCVNWMRETVSSFATQRDAMIRKKVLQRLTELIDSEEKTRKLLMRAPLDYTPPICQFVTTFPQQGAGAKSGARGRPTSSGAANTAQQKPHCSKVTTNTEASLLNATNAADITAKLIAASKPKIAKQNFEVLYGPKEIYRQIDSNIMLILNERLTLTFPLPSEDIGRKFGLIEFRFVLTDLVSKLESITGVQKFHSEQTLQHIAKPDYFMYDLSKFLHQIMGNMEMISTAINEQLENVKRLYSHADLFTEKFNYLKVCFGLCLRLLAAFFSWYRFTDTSMRSSLLKESLLALLEPTQPSRLSGKTYDIISVEVFNKCIKYEPFIVDLKTCIYLHHLLLNLKSFASKDGEGDNDNGIGEKQAHEIRTLCNTLLCRKWYNYDGLPEKGASCNIYLDELVKGFLKGSDFRRQSSIVIVLLAECKKLSSKDGALKSFPNIKRANFPLLFRGICEILISSLNDRISGVGKHGTNSTDKLKIWEKSCELLNLLLEILQNLDVPRNFQLFLKYAHLYLKLVLQYGLQVFEEKLCNDPQRVSVFLKNLQVTTRFLHKICCHSKALKNTSIISQIPFLRETVESLVFRVKALMTANKCASVFTMGNLKNKDIHGDEILSQRTSIGSGSPNDDDSEEEIPEDDESIDETILGQDELVVSTDGPTRATRSSTKSSSRSKCF